MDSSEDPQEILRRKFPEMKPIKSAPSLSSLNGFGLGMRGKRDYDAETGTYVKAHCVTALFVPLFALGAYRVADSQDGGWYFLGKVPFKTFGRVLNTAAIAIIALIAGLVWWNSHIDSPEYKAAQQLEQAEELNGKGEHIKAASIYRDMIVEGLPSEGQARKGLRDSLVQAVKSDSPGKVIAALDITSELPGFIFGNSEPIPGLLAHVENSVDRFSDARPADAIRIINASENLLIDQGNLDEKKEPLLVRLTKDQPGNTKFAVDLAGSFEQTDRLDEALAVLEPHLEKLGNGEGARIRGQILLTKGQAAEAVPLLERYIKPRLKTWRAAETVYNAAADIAYRKVTAKLERDEGPKSFYKAYDGASSDEERREILDDYVYERMQRDPVYLRAGRQYEQSRRIVPVIMDLGISELQVAQKTADPERRKELLKKAEQHFLSLKNAAGQSSEFKFFLGQVYYWSGDQDKGRTLFDELLAASKRNVGTLLTLSSTLREIGNYGEARTLAEEAYGKANTDDDKNSAAGQRAVLHLDVDDEIAWLEKMTGGDLNHTTRLAGARAKKASSDGNTAEAIKQLKIAEDGWSKLPVTAATLNNGAIVQSELFALTGKISHHEAGSRMMDRAVALQPENSVLLGNAATSLASTAMMQLVEGRLDPRIIREGIGFDSLRFVYQDEAGRNGLIQSLAAKKNFVRAMELLDKALLLSPNNKSLYQLGLAYHGFVLDHKALENLSTRLQAARLVHTRAVADHVKYMRGDKDDTVRDDTTTALKYKAEILAGITDKAQRRHIEVDMAESRLSLFSIGDAADHAKEIAFLRQAYRDDPCVKHGNALVTALSQKAALALAKKNAAFGIMFESCHRYLHAKSILVLALTSETLRPGVLANATAREALTLELEQQNLFPSTRGPESVIIAGALAPNQLEEARRQLNENKLIDISGRIAPILAPWQPNILVTRYFLLIARGKPAEAKTLLEEARNSAKVVPTF